MDSETLDILKKIQSGTWGTQQMLVVIAVLLALLFFYGTDRRVLDALACCTVHWQHFWCFERVERFITLGASS